MPRFSSFRGTLWIAVFLALILFWTTRDAIWRATQPRVVKENADLVRYLPESDASLLYIDVDSVRAAGWGDLLSNLGKDRDYARFVEKTGFEVSRNLDAVAVEMGTAPRGTEILVKGQFSWANLQGFARDSKGSCSADLCSFTFSSNRRISFRTLQPDVVSVTLRDPADSGGPRSATEPNTGPETAPQHAANSNARTVPHGVLAWVRLGTDTLAQTTNLPSYLKTTASVLSGGRDVTLSLAPPVDNSNAALELRLTANYPEALSASNARTHLEIQTKLASLELAREHKRANPADLSSLLTGGSFEAKGNELVGTWPVHRELLDALTR